MKETKRQYLMAAHNDDSKPETRIIAIDLFRGIALTLVLVDHIDFWASQGFLRNWTLMGIGYADAADIFAVLSGFTFGWCNGDRIKGGSLWQLQSKVFRRGLQLFLAYLLLGVAISLAATCFQTLPGNGLPALIPLLSLQYQPFGLGILCFYIVVIPFMPVALVALHRNTFAAISCSLLIYLSAPFLSELLFVQTTGAPWHFNPLAWQFLLIIGMVFGLKTREGAMSIEHSRSLLAFSVVLLLVMLALKQYHFILADDVALTHHDIHGTVSWLTSKSMLGPLRILNLASLAYVATFLFRHANLRWIKVVGGPFICCGRRPLTCYCIGIVLTYLSALVMSSLSGGTAVLLILVVSACALQFGIAWRLAVGLDRWIPVADDPKILAVNGDRT